MKSVAEKTSGETSVPRKVKLHTIPSGIAVSVCQTPKIVLLESDAIDLFFAE